MENLKNTVNCGVFYCYYYYRSSSVVVVVVVVVAVAHPQGL